MCSGAKKAANNLFVFFGSGGRRLFRPLNTSVIMKTTLWRQNLRGHEQYALADFVRLAGLFEARLAKRGAERLAFGGRRLRRQGQRAALRHHGGGNAALLEIVDEGVRIRRRHDRGRRTNPPQKCLKKQKWMHSPPIRGQERRIQGRFSIAGMNS